MKLTSTTITIPVERDGVATGEIRFDPQDLRFVEGFYQLMDGLGERERAYSQLAEEGAVRLRALSELCGWVRTQVNEIFGDGSCEVLFGSLCSLELFRQFFEGIEPHLRSASAKRKGRYRASTSAAMQ